MATIWANRRPIRDGAARRNEVTCRISQIPSAPAEQSVPRREAQDGKMLSPERCVEDTAKIATRPLSDRWSAVGLLPRFSQPRLKSSPRKFRPQRAIRLTNRYAGANPNVRSKRLV